MDISNLFYSLLNLYYDLLIGGKFLGGTVAPLRKEFSSTANTSYLALKHIFNNIHIDQRDIIVEVGCGKGRVINYLLYHKIKNQIEGFEYNPIIADQVAERMRPYPNVTIHAGDIFEHFPYHGTLFYFYHPFKRPLVERFKKCLDKINQNQALRIIYYFPLHLEVFSQDERYLIENFYPKNKRIYRYALIERKR